MATAYISEIRLFPWDWAPKSWALCQGQLMGINQNQALFSLIGTTYGGDGRTTFGLPDLRGRAIVGTGTSTAGGNFAWGQVGGVEAVTLSQSDIPQHSHSWKADTDPGNSIPPASTYLSTAHKQSSTSDTVAIYAAPSAITPLANSLQPAGGNQPHSNMQPMAALSYCICLYGVFPSRN